MLEKFIDKIKKVITVLIISILAFFGIFGYFISKYWNEYVRRHPKMYAYETYMGPANFMLVIEDLKYKDEYLEHYHALEKKQSLPFNFPLRSIEMCIPIYVMGYTEDSLLADVVRYKENINPNLETWYYRVWVYAKALHKAPPPKECK